MTLPDEPVDLGSTRARPLGAPAAPVTGSFPAPYGPPPRHRSQRGLIIGLSVALVVALLGAGAVVVALMRRSPPPATGSVAAASAANATQSPAVPASAAAAASSPKVRAFGETIAADNVSNSTVYGYKQPTASAAPAPDQAGYVWGAADVKVCAGVGVGDAHVGISVSRAPWGLVYADSTLIQPSGTGYRQFQQPEYPWGDHGLNWGQCVRGWITFAVPADKRPVMVEYQPGGGPAAGQSFDWKVS